MESCISLTVDERFPKMNSKEQSMVENKPTDLVHENEILKQKISKIETDNIAQQRRLQQLEKIVTKLTCNRSQALDPDIQHPPSANESPLRSFSEKCETIVKKQDREPLVDESGVLDGDNESDAGDGLSRDVISLMDEFDRIAIEKGLTYGMTPTHSVADSDDLTESSGVKKSWMDSVSHCASTSAEAVSTSPLPTFLTPSYQHWKSVGGEYSKHYEPSISPQLSFTTPVLLTAEALREAEKQQKAPHLSSTRGGTHSDEITPFTFQDHSAKRRTLNLMKKYRVSPFANLLAGIHQTTQSHPSLINPGKSSQPTKEDAREPWHHMSTFKGPPGFYSPGSSSSVGSGLSHIRKWTQSQRLPLLSPLPKSLCSDLQTHVSLL